MISFVYDQLHWHIDKCLTWIAQAIIKPYNIRYQMEKHVFITSSWTTARRQLEGSSSATQLTVGEEGILVNPVFSFSSNPHCLGMNFFLLFDRVRPVYSVLKRTLLKLKVLQINWNIKICLLVQIARTERKQISQNDFITLYIFRAALIELYKQNKSS